MSSYSSPLSSSKGTMQAGSVRKRKQIPSDEEEEESSHLTHTPDPQLRKRTEKESAAKVKRGLRLEELRQKRTKSLAKKILPQDSHINSSLTESLEACEQDVLEEDEHVQELPLDDNHDGSEYMLLPLSWYQTFPQELCSSSVDSEEDPKNPGSQDESQETFSSADNDGEEEDDLSDFIDFEGDSQDQIARDELQQLIGKPSREEAHKVIVERILISLLDNKPLETESDQRFNQAKNVIETLLCSKKDLVGSSVWAIDFKQMLIQCSVLQDTPLLQTIEAICEACRRPRTITQLFCFYQELNGEIVRKFRIGCYCADKALIYHRIHHYCSVELKKACEEKLGELLAVSGKESSKESVEKYCSDHQPWLRKLFDDFKELLDKADEWAVDGKKHRKMMSAISSYMY